MARAVGTSAEAGGSADAATETGGSRLGGNGGGGEGSLLGARFFGTRGEAGGHAGEGGGDERAHGLHRAA